MNSVKRMYSRTKYSYIALVAILSVSTTAIALDPPSVTIDSTEPGSPITIYTEDAVLPDSINVGVNVTSTYGEDPNIGPAENPVNIQQVLLGVDDAASPITAATTGDDTEDQVKSWFGIVDLTNAADAASPTFSTTIEAYAAINLYYDPTTTDDGQQADKDSVAITVNIEDLFDLDSTDDGDPMPDEADWDTFSGGEILNAIGLSGNPVVTKIGNLGGTECYSLMVDGNLLEVCIDASNTSLGDLQTTLAGTTEVDNATDGLFVLTLATSSQDLNTDGYTLLDEGTPNPNASDIFARVILILEQGIGSNTWTALSVDLPEALALGYTVGGSGVIDPNVMRVYTTDVTRTVGVNSTYTITDATAANDAFIYELGDSDGAGIDDPMISPTDDHFFEGIIRDINSILGFQIELGEDTTSPVIFIIGDNPIFILIGDEYVDLGATVYDEVDGISAANELSNNVNTALEGNYTVVYSAPDDAAGNPVTPETRNVFVRAVLTPPPPQGGGGGGGGGCFIATAAYGTPLAQEIDTLREVRDTYLLSNSLGTAFVDAYYRISPSIADDVAAHPALAAMVRAMLTPIIFISQLLLSHTAWLLALTGFSLLMVVRIIRKKTPKNANI